MSTIVETRDELAATVALLRTNASLIALTTVGRIVGVRLSEEAARPMPRPAVVVNRAGGWPGPGGRSWLSLKTQRIDVRCYGATDAEASQVYRRVHAVLKNWQTGTVAGVRIYSYLVELSGINTLEPDTKWPVCFGSYAMQFNEIPVEED